MSAVTVRAAGRREGWAEALRSLKVASWLGWQIESNWTDPFLFATYAIIKPVSGALILVFMYIVIAQGGLSNPLFPYIYVGNAFYIYVGAVLMGISFAVIDDREHYGMLKYIYVSPIHVYTYLLGRGFAKTATATMAVTITMVFGVAFLGVSLVPGGIDYGLLVPSLILGLAGLALMGILLAGVSLITARHNYYVGEAVAGALYLVCGAVFPLEVLPRPLQLFGQVLPLTYWLEALRRAILGKSASPTLSSISNDQLLLILGGTTLFFGVVSLLFYRWCEHRAKERGLIDMQTMY